MRGGAIEAWAAFDSLTVQWQARQMLLTDPNSAVRQAAIGVLNPADLEVRTLLTTSTEPKWPLGIRQSAAYQIRNQDDPAVVAALIALTDPSNPRNLRQAGLRYLAGRSDKAPAIATATTYLSDPDPLFAVSAVQTLARVGGAGRHGHPDAAAQGGKAGDGR